MKKLVYITMIASLVLGFSFNSQLNAQGKRGLTLDLGNDTLMCPGDAIYLDAGKFVQYKWSDGSKKSYLLVTEPGTYSVAVRDYNGEFQQDTIIVGLAPVPDVSLNFKDDVSICQGEQVCLAANVKSGSGNEIYSWSNGRNNDKVHVDNSGSYSVTITNEYGCSAVKEVNVEFTSPYEEDKVLLATYDPTLKKNVVIWSKTPGERTQKYALYAGNKESDLLQYADFQENNMVVDQNSNPEKQSHVYNVRVVDSCNNLSSLKNENAHETMHLKVSKNKKNRANLIWTPYVGFEYEWFYIYRKAEGEKIGMIDSVKFVAGTPKYKYVDKDIKKRKRYQYVIKVKTPETIFLGDPGDKKAGNGPFVHSLSNIDENLNSGDLGGGFVPGNMLEDNNPDRVEPDNMDNYTQYADAEIEKTGVEDIFNQNLLKVYPNPSCGDVNISYQLKTEGMISLTIYNMQGKQIENLMNGHQEAGEYNYRINPASVNMPNGIYLVRLQYNKQVVLTQRMITR